MVLAEIFLDFSGIVLIVLLFFIALIGVGLALALLFWKTEKVLAPRIALIVLNSLEVPLKTLLNVFGGNEDIIDDLIIQISNNMYLNAFSGTPYNERIIFFPQCLRNPDCPAKLSSTEGIQCIGCGRCRLGELKKYAESLGYKVFIVPGSSFIKRIVKRYKPKAILGVGCRMELIEGIKLSSSFGLPPQAVPLLRDGCVGTTTDFSLLKRTIDSQNLKIGITDSARVMVKDLKKDAKNLWD